MSSVLLLALRVRNLNSNGELKRLSHTSHDLIFRLTTRNWNNRPRHYEEENQMPDTERDELAIDPPDNSGGTGSKADLDSPADEDAAAAIDPPSNDGGH